MQVDFLIQNGTVVDGTGAKPYRADVRICDGIIAEIGANLTRRARERIVDAEGHLVTPGFIESHNHWDGAMWWSPFMEPTSAYGITTSVNGNCGFSLAPLNSKVDMRKDIIDIFNYFEDIPENPMTSVLTWDWKTWSEYKASMERNVRTPVNVAFFCGHIALRLAVMGADAWNRAATPAEIEEMCALLDDALAAGALGLSSNLLDYDEADRPLPSFKADDAEYLALMTVIARHPGATMQVIIDNFNPGRMHGPEQLERMGRLIRQTGIRMHWPAMPFIKFQAPLLQQEVEIHQKFVDEGLDIWAGIHNVAPTMIINFVRTLLFAQHGLHVWQEIVAEQDEGRKLAMLANPAWRERARESWNTHYSHSVLHDPSALTLRESETGQGPTGVTLADYMASTGAPHPSDALADWVLANGPESTVLMRQWELDDDVIIACLLDPQSVASISDAGAHAKLFCGVGDNILLLTEFVRDRKLLEIEEAVHALTGKLSNFFGLHDRGTIEVGKRADVAIFDLDKIERRPEIKVWDVPNGSGTKTYRYSRAPAPMLLTLVNGIATFDNGDVTGNFPGQIVGPRGNIKLAIAAE